MDRKKDVMILVTIAVVCLAPMTKALSVSVDISSQMAHPGDNITVECRLTGGDMSHIAFIYKEIADNEGKPIRNTITTGDTMMPKYTGLKRFSIDKRDAGSAVLFVLHITNVTVNDSGHYGCYEQEESDSYDSARMEVYKQATQVFFTNYTSGDVIDMEENQPMDLECNVMGVVPSPDVKIVLAGVNHEDDFTRKTHTEIMCESDSSCPLHFHYDISLSSFAFLPQKISDGDSISCQSFIPHGRYRPVVASHKIRYRFSPKFHCESIQYASIHEQHAHISCNVSSRPDPFDMVWTFSVSDHDYEIRPKVPMSDSHQEFSAEMKRINETFSTVRLVISEVSDKHFSNYHLTVYHELGNNTVDISLREFEDTPPTGSATVVTSSVLVFMFISFISALLS